MGQEADRRPLQRGRRADHLQYPRGWRPYESPPLPTCAETAWVSERQQPNGEQDSSREQGSPPVQERSESASRIKGQTAWVVLASQMLGLAIGVSQGLLVEHPDRELVALSIVLV